MRKGNIKYLIGEWIAMSKRSFVQTLVRIPVELLLPTVMALIPKLVIDAITAKVTDTALLALIGVLTVFLVALSVIQPYFYGKLSKTRFEFDLKFSMSGLKKMLDTDYQRLESFAGRKGYERAKAFCGMDNSAAATAGSFIWLFSSIVISVCGIFSYMILFAVIQPYLVIIIVASSVLEFVMLKKDQDYGVLARGENITFWTKLEYFYRIATEPKAGKDVRLYGLSDWFCKVLANLLALTNSVYNKLFRKKIKLTFGQSLAIMIRDGASYGFLIYFVIAGEMELSNFIMYFGLLVGFSNWITGLATSIYSLKNIDVECGKYRDFIEEVGHADDGKLPYEGELETVEFRDVCFCYEGADSMALKDINFKIAINDRIAIVGENGAGKTTLIKLLCGLYKPTSGEILINGMPIGRNIGKKYYELFATVFQDFYFLPLTIMENISMLAIEKSDENRVIEAITKAGLNEKIESLPDGLRSKMLRQVWEDAVEFSCGEQQRLLLARALYKDSPILILDEPTSALDPIAEEKIYSNYKDYSQGKISIFISHRLASTQFCSTVFYMSDGQIAERGSHEELLAQEGKYWSMFNAQAYYYKHASIDKVRDNRNPDNSGIIDNISNADIVNQGDIDIVDSSNGCDENIDTVDSVSCSDNIDSVNGGQGDE